MSKSLAALGGVVPGLCLERAYPGAENRVGSLPVFAVRHMLGGRTGWARNGNTVHIHPQFSVYSCTPNSRSPIAANASVLARSPSDPHASISAPAGMENATATAIDTELRELQFG